LNRDQIVKTARLTSCKNFVGKRKKFIFDAFVDLKPGLAAVGSTEKVSSQEVSLYKSDSFLYFSSLSHKQCSM